MKPVIFALIDTIVMLESAPDELIDLDSEVQIMEQVAASLQTMTKRQRSEFARALKERAGTTKDAAKRELILQMPEALGFSN